MIEQILNSTLLLFAILTIASLSGLVSEKVGIINIAINGMMIVGGFCFRLFGYYFKGDENEYFIILAILLAMLATGLFSLLHGFATIKLKANHVVSGTAINLLAAGIVVFLVSVLGPKFAINGGEKSFRSIFNNPIVVGNNFYFYNLLFAALSFFVIANIFVFFKYTKFGFRFKAVGENPNAADSAAINVNRYKWIGVFFSGLLAGLSGAITMFKLPNFQGQIGGLGFLALAIMILGQWKTIIIAIVSLLFSFTYSLVDIYVIKDIPSALFKMLPFVLSIASLILLSKYQSAPKALGQHFDKTKK